MSTVVAPPEGVRSEMRRNVAAVDSELALLPALEQKLPLAGPLRNPLYAATNAAWLHPTGFGIGASNSVLPSLALPRAA